MRRYGAIQVSVSVAFKLQFHTEYLASVANQMAKILLAMQFL